MTVATDLCILWDVICVCHKRARRAFSTFLRRGFAHYGNLSQWNPSRLMCRNEVNKKKKGCYSCHFKKRERKKTHPKEECMKQTWGQYMNVDENEYLLKRERKSLIWMFVFSSIRLCAMNRIKYIIPCCICLTGRSSLIFLRAASVSKLKVLKDESPVFCWAFAFCFEVEVEFFLILQC